MQKLKKLGVMSVAKVYGLLGVVFGLIVGIALALFGAAFSGTGIEGTGIQPYTVADGSNLVAGFGLAAIIIAPIVYGVLFFIMGAVGAFIINIILGITKGIEIELE